jgi:hypothetical protein
VKTKFLDVAGDGDNVVDDVGSRFDRGGNGDDTDSHGVIGP